MKSPQLNQKRKTTQEAKRFFWKKMIWISAISLVLSVGGFLVVPIIGMINALVILRTPGAADPSELAAGISTSLISGLVTIPFALMSLMLFLVAIFRHRKLSGPVHFESLGIS